MTLEKKIRKLRYTGVSILLIFVLLLGCNLPQRILTPSPTVSNTQTQSPLESSIPINPSPATSLEPTYPQVNPTATVPITSTALPPNTIPPINNPAQYNLEAVLDYKLHSASVVEKVHYPNFTPVTLTDLLFVVEPNLVPGGFELVSITWEGGESVDRYDLNENQLSVNLPQPLQPGEELGIIINYRLYLPALGDMSIAGRPEAYGFSEKQTNLADWYPYVAPYNPEHGWLVHPTWSFGEYQVYDVADYDVDISLAAPIPDLVIAASASPLREGDHYIYHLEDARTFVLSLSTEYAVETTTMDGVTITSYSFPYDTAAGQEALNNTADALRLFSRLISPYPRAALSVVEADFLDGMEYDGLFFLSYGFYNLYDGTPKGYLTFIAAHETAHQWWYGLVGNDQALEPWLDEALSTYMELIFYQNNYLDYSPPSGGSLENWWWYFRVYFYDPTGWVDSPLYAFNDSRPYRDAVYLRGAIFLDELRNTIGDPAFFAFLRDYAQTNAHSIATAKDFFSILRNHTSQDLYALITTYFQTSK